MDSTSVGPPARLLYKFYGINPHLESGDYGKVYRTIWWSLRSVSSSQENISG